MGNFGTILARRDKPRAFLKAWPAWILGSPLPAAVYDTLDA